MQQLSEILDAKLIARHKSQEKRTYLGASMIGDECARKVQMQFLGKEEEVSAQTLRTFDIGHVLEDLVAQWLMIAGIDLKTRDEKGQQFGFSVASSKIQGHVDGIIVGASATIPGLKFPALWECKTLNESSWKDTAKRGVLVSKPLYYAQIQLYMAYMNLENCLFTALNKNDSQLYFEWVQFDTEAAQRYSDRAVQIIKASENKEFMPCISRDPSFFKCKMCGFREACQKVA